MPIGYVCWESESSQRVVAIIVANDNIAYTHIGRVVNGIWKPKKDLICRHKVWLGSGILDPNMIRI